MEHRFPGQLQLRPSLVEEPAHFRIHVAHPAQSQPADTNQKRNEESERDAELASRGVLFHCPCLLLMQHNGSNTIPGVKALTPAAARTRVSFKLQRGRWYNVSIVRHPLAGSSCGGG